MSPVTLPEPPAIVAANEKLSAAEVARIIREPNGASALLLLLRSDRVDMEIVIEAINKMQDNRKSKLKRLFLTIFDAVMPV